MPEQQAAQMSGVERAAVFLLSLGEENAAAVLKHLDPSQVQNVGAAISNLSSVTTEKKATVIDEFTSSVQETSALAGSEQYVRNMLNHALGPDKAKSMLGRILQDHSRKGLDTLKWMDPASVSSILKDEHPQICAIVMLSLEPEQSAQILKLIEKEKRSDIMIRIAGLDSVKPDALEELDDLIGRQLLQKNVASSSKVDGIRGAAEILNFLDSNSESEILEEIEESDETLSDAIREKMFIFENLLVLDDKDMQRLLREVETESLVIALKGTEQAVRVHFFSNMSKRAAELLKDDIEMRGPLKLSEVETAQKEVLNIAARLADEGEISMRSSGDDEYV